MEWNTKIYKRFITAEWGTCGPEVAKFQPTKQTYVWSMYKHTFSETQYTCAFLCVPEHIINEVKLSLCTPWKRMESGHTTPPIHNLGTRWEWSASSPARLTPWKRAPLPTEQDIGWVLQTVWMFWRRKKILARPGNWTTTAWLLSPYCSYCTK
jgi:hypothetical protein